MGEIASPCLTPTAYPKNRNTYYNVSHMIWHDYTYHFIPCSGL